MHTYQLNADESIELPTSYEEINVGQFEKIRAIKPQDKESRLISILTGIEEAVIGEWDIDQVDEIMEVLDFLYTDKIDISKYPIPEELEVNGKIIKPKVDVRIANINQRWSFEKRLWPALAMNNGIIDTNLSVALAIYLQPMIIGEKFDDDHLDPTIEICKSLPVLKAYPIAYFFTTACERSSKKRKNSLKNRLSQMLNVQQASKESQHLESSIPSTPLPEEMSSNTTQRQNSHII